MDFAKFAPILDKRALFFSRVDKLGDPFEGAWSDATVRAFRDIKGSKIPEEEKNILRGWQRLAKWSRVSPRFTLVNCWHGSERESEAMWRLYSGYGYGLAVKTDFKSLIRSFTDRLPNIIARVEYIPYETEVMPMSLMAPFLHKRIGFKHEQEVRAIVTEYIYKKKEDPDGREDVKIVDSSKDVCDVGIHYDIDPADLIQEVVVSPYAARWLLELTQSVSKRYDLDVPVRQSELAGNPIWE